jgi:site-specific recombinase XerD
MQDARWTRWTEAVATVIAARPSPETQRSYRRAWADWLDHLDGRGPWEATRRDVLAWIKRLRARGLQRNTVAQRLLQCHAIGQALQAAGLVAMDQEDLFTLAGTDLTVDQTLRRTPALTGEQVDALLAIRIHTATGARDFALLATLLATGARPHEVLELRVGDVVAPSGGAAHATVKLPGRVVPVPARIYDVVQVYLDLAGRWHARPEHFLWRPLRNDAAACFGHELPLDRPITLTQLNNILRKRLDWAGVAQPERYSANSLRATFAREWQVVQPGDTAELQRRLGHKRWATTEKWLVTP